MVPAYFPARTEICVKSADHMITIRMPDEIYQSSGEIENGMFHGRWHFSFDEYDDPEHMRFGPLRVFNDDTLSPGAVWPLHPHSEIEVVTYCAGGEFRHADETGKGGILRKGWVQHTTVGTGMYHSELNNRKDQPMRFIQMWFMPAEHGLKPSVEQKPSEKSERTNRLFPLVANDEPGALKIHQDVKVYSSFLERGHSVVHTIGNKRGVYLYVVERGPVSVNNNRIPEFGAAQVTNEKEITIKAIEDAELLLIDVSCIDL
jgi:redox-sensitive bicupin YhaK (pirin superfamily)